MIRRSFATLLFAAAAAFGTGVFAVASSGDRSADTLSKIFSQPALDSSLFAPNFLAKIPVSDVQAFVGSYVARIGAPTGITRDGFEYAVTSPKGSIKVNIAFDEGGRISSLLFHDEVSSDNLSALQRVLGADTISPDWFEESYLHDVPTEKLTTLLADMHSTLGKFVRVDMRHGKYFAIFDKGESHAQISTDSDNRIDYLAFSKP